MALDLNMGYYTIRLDPRAVKIFTIIFPGYLWDMLVLQNFLNRNDEANGSPRICTSIH